MLIYITSCLAHTIIIRSVIQMLFSIRITCTFKFKRANLFSFIALSSARRANEMHNNNKTMKTREEKKQKKDTDRRKKNYRSLKVNSWLQSTFKKFQTLC